jgi:hypothetical protein
LEGKIEHRGFFFNKKQGEMARWVSRKGGMMIGSSSRASKQMGLTRDLQNLVVERRRQGNKMGIKKERKQIWVFCANFC